jgi:ABC-2 type transport system ATP-binding protein
MSASDGVLAAHRLSKSYGSRQALRDFDLHLDPGEMVVLVGPNGAGKTTLFGLLSGLLEPDSGRVLIAGEDLRHERVRAVAQLGIVFQEPALDLELGVAANLKFHARLHGLRRASRRVRDSLESFDLTAEARTPVRHLSGGNRRKVELARALLHRPRLLLMDEATVGLDPGSRQQLLRRVRHLSATAGVAVLWATHLIDEADVADRVVVIDAGRKRLDGPPARVLPAGPGPRDIPSAARRPGSDNRGAREWAQHVI